MAIHVESSGQPLSWFKDRLTEQRLVFKPPFQRNPVWLDKHKAYLVDTALHRLPIPEVYIQKETDQEGHTVWSVIDGQQRIRTLLEFTRGEVELMDEYSPGRDGERWEDLTGDEKIAFWNYRILTREVEGASDTDLRDMFTRLNRHTVSLNAQELRNARHKGEFITTVTELADQEFWAESGIVTANEIRRMLDIEYVAELLIGIMHGPQNKKSTLDGFFEAYEGGIPDKQAWLARFEQARSTIVELIPDLRHSRWRGKSDFYSIFLAVDACLQKGALRVAKLKQAQKALADFGQKITLRLSKEGGRGRVSESVRRYSTAVEKASSDKDRRGARHDVLTVLFGPFFG